jgi:hypothetical protein
LALAVDALLEPEADELVLGQAAAEELLGLVVEVVELALEHRDNVARDVLDHLGVLERPLPALPLRLGGNRLHVASSSASRRRVNVQSSKSRSGFKH